MCCGYLRAALGSVSRRDTPLPRRLRSLRKRRTHVRGCRSARYSGQKTQATAPQPRGCGTRNSEQQILRLRSGFRLRTAASLTPVKRFKLSKIVTGCQDPARPRAIGITFSELHQSGQESIKYCHNTVTLVALSAKKANVLLCLRFSGAMRMFVNVAQENILRPGVAKP